MKKLIVNADDFGWSRSVNAGIIECYKNGIVTRTSLLATGEAFDDAVTLARQNPDLQIGVHLNFYRGKPLLKLSGILPNSVYNFLMQIVTKKITNVMVEKEFRAQIDKVKATGLKISHLDSEKHLHLWPSVFKIVCKLAKDYQIPYVRLVREKFSTNPISLVLTLLSHYNARTLSMYGLETADSTIGVSEAPVDVSAFEHLLGNGRGECVELVVHPGFLDEQFWQMQKNIANKLTYSRKAEAVVLSSYEAKELTEKYEYTLDSNPN